MTRIIAIVVVIVAAVLAYMYTSAGDVEIGEVPSASQPLGETDLDSAAVPGEEAAVTNPAQEALVEEDGVEGDAAEEEVVAPAEDDAGPLDEAEAIEGADVPTSDVLEDTAETVPAEEGPADEEPDTGVGAVSTEEETDGAGVEGIISEQGEQAGLAGDVTESADIVEADPATAEEVGDPGQTPETLDTSVDNAPEAVGVSEGAEEEAAAAEAADGQGVAEEIEQATEGAPAVEEGATTDVGAAPAEDEAESAVVESEVVATEVETTETAIVEPAAPEPGADAAAADPGPALRSNAPAEAAAAPGDIDALLDAENLDVPAVTAAIEASDLEPALKTQLTEALTTAQDSPGLLPDVLARIRAALAGE